MDNKTPCKKNPCGHPVCCLGGMPDFLGSHEVVTVSCDVCYEIEEAKRQLLKDLETSVTHYAEEKRCSVGTAYEHFLSRMRAAKENGYSQYGVIKRYLEELAL